MNHVARFTVLNLVGIFAIGLWYFEAFGIPAFSIDDYLRTRSFLAQVVVLPFVETLLFQSLVIEATAWTGTRILGKDREGILLVLGGLLSAALFMATHLAMNGLFNAVVFSITGGITFATIYVLNRGNGRQAAFASTWLLHLATNALFMLAFAFFARQFA